jgi:hypothetical protein
MLLRYGVGAGCCRRSTAAVSEPRPRQILGLCGLVRDHRCIFSFAIRFAVSCRAVFGSSRLAHPVTFLARRSEEEGR